MKKVCLLLAMLLATPVSGVYSADQDPFAAMNQAPEDAPDNYEQEYHYQESPAEQSFEQPAPGPQEMPLAAPAQPMPPAPQAPEAPAPAPIPSQPTPIAGQQMLSQEDMSLVKGNVDTRKVLLQKAEEARKKAMTIVTRLEGHKQGWYERYLDLDGQLDVIYQTAGVTRGKVGENITDIVDGLVREAANGGMNDAALQKRVAGAQQLLENFKMALTVLAEKEEAVLGVVQQMTGRIDTALDASVELSDLARQVRTTADDSQAQSFADQVAAKLQEIERLEAELEQQSKEAISLAINQAQEQVKSVQALTAELKEIGISLSVYADKYVGKKQQVKQVIPEEQPVASLSVPTQGVKKKTVQQAA